MSRFRLPLTCLALTGCVRTCAFGNCNADNAACLTSDLGSGWCCNGSCVDGADSQNCGRCGNVCPSDTACAADTCDAGELAAAAPFGGAATCFRCLPARCDGLSTGTACALAGGTLGSCCNAECVTLGVPDPANCGGCGIACESATTCVELPADAGPGVSFSCVNDDCVDAGEGTVCAFSSHSLGTCCNGTCITPGTVDSANCGACGLACKSLTTCLELASDAGPGVTFSCVNDNCIGVAQGVVCAVPPFWLGACIDGGCSL